MRNWKYRQYLPYMGIMPLLGVLLALKLETMTVYGLLNRAVLLVLGYIAAWGDFKEKRVSNRTVLIMLAAWMILLTPQLFYHTEEAVAAALSGVFGFLLAGVLFLLIYFISRKGLGGGDVKFMAAAGLFLGFNGVLPAMLWGAVLAAVTGLVLIVTKRMGRKDTISLIPFLYVGIVMTVYFQ